MFMKPFIVKQTGYDVETEIGSEFVSLDLVGQLSEDDIDLLREPCYENDKIPAIHEQVAQYLEGTKIESIDEVSGWLAYMSAPGYMDRTDYGLFDTEARAAQCLLDMALDHESTDDDERQAIADLEKVAKPQPKAPTNPTDLELFTQAYIEALFFTDTGDDGQPPADAELSEDARLDIEADCRSFWRRFGCYITTEICSKAFNNSVSQAGHDFHLTRNGHGAGFWDGDWPKEYSDMLDKGAKCYGELRAYLGDDGLIYVQ